MGTKKWMYGNEIQNVVSRQNQVVLVTSNVYNGVRTFIEVVGDDPVFYLQPNVPILSSFFQTGFSTNESDSTFEFC